MFFYCMNYTLILIMFTSKVFSFYFRSVARDTIHSGLKWPRLYAVFSFIPPDKWALYVGRDERRASLKTPVWEATIGINTVKIFFFFFPAPT